MVYVDLIGFTLCLLILCAESRPLFSLEEYDVPECDQSLVGHTINAHRNGDRQRVPYPLLKFNAAFVEQHLFPEDIDHTNAIVVVDPHIITRADKDMQMRLLSILNDGHIVAFQTDAFAHLNGELEPENEFLNDIASFETLSGVVLPFYTTTANVDNISVPLFHLNLTSVDGQHPPDILIWEDAVALNFSKKTKSHPNQGAIMSLLDILNQNQLVCLLFRLHCNYVAPADPTFHLCLYTALRLRANTLRLPALTKFHTLLKYTIGWKGQSGLISRDIVAEKVFKDKLANVRKAYTLMQDGHSNAQIHQALFRPLVDLQEGFLMSVGHVIVLSGIGTKFIITTLRALGGICVFIAVVEVTNNLYDVLLGAKRVFSQLFPRSWLRWITPGLTADRAKLF